MKGYPAITLIVLAPLLVAEPALDGLEDFLIDHCYDCHDGGRQKGGLNLENAFSQGLIHHSAIWEKAIKRIDAGQMPPPRKSQPSVEEKSEALKKLSSYFDQRAARHPDPGHVPGIRRLTRTEYQNAVRDLLGVTVDATALLPKDESSHGFDNITVSSLSPTLMTRYLNAARKIARVAAGAAGEPEMRILRVAPDVTQEKQLAELPPGTRGGMVFAHTFPVDGYYELEMRLTRDRDEKVEGIFAKHTMEILLDGQSAADFEIRPPKDWRDHSGVDAHLKIRLPVEQGTRQVGVTFVERVASLRETMRQPYLASFNRHRHPRRSPALFQVSLSGPFAAKTNPAVTRDEARRRLKPLLRRAYRKPLRSEDLEKAMTFFDQGGMEEAISSILVSPRFLLKVESTPPGVKAGEAYPLSAYELASRLSFFLWSSLPDEELLSLAEQGTLTRPDVLDRQVRRLLADPRSDSLVTNFANQWLHLRNLEGVSPDLRLFPDFDDNLRQALRLETEHFVRTIFQEDRPVGNLLKADFTFLNERLARHYGIPGILGSRFRRVELSPDRLRGGLLRHGSILAVTSYANRTSPVIRGNWVLENILGTPTPPPPPNTPSLDEVVVSDSLPMREKLALHRAKESCATCHRLMDPIGFALEGYDALGRVRRGEVDVRGGLPDGRTFSGVAALEDGLLSRPDLFARTVTEKLLTYALGRGVEPGDAPAIRRIVRESARSDYRFSDLVRHLVRSLPFTHRQSS